MSTNGQPAEAHALEYPPAAENARHFAVPLTPGARLCRAARAACARVRAVLARWSERRRQRRTLAGMGPYLLNDIGITPAEAGSDADSRSSAMIWAGSGPPCRPPRAQRSR